MYSRAELKFSIELKILNNSKTNATFGELSYTTCHSHTVFISRVNLKKINTGFSKQNKSTLSKNSYIYQKIAKYRNNYKYECNE